MWQKILTVRPGITDPVTLRLRSEAELLTDIAGDTEQYYVNELQPAKLKGYVAYLDERDWRSDLKILLRTMFAVVMPHEATRVSIDEVRQLPE
jgi:lipopolysaccharide/colanic/teichoic acid biosynthesis glycosyltransferase